MSGKQPTYIERSGPLTKAQIRTWPRAYWAGKFGISWQENRRWSLASAGLSPTIDECRQALWRLVRHHEILRTIFIVGGDGHPWQLVLAAESFKIPIASYGIRGRNAISRSDARLHTDAQRPSWKVHLHTSLGRVIYVDCIFSHAISDHAGMEQFWTQFVRLLKNPSTNLDPVTQPIDRALDEQRVGGPMGAPLVSRRDPFLDAPQLVAAPVEFHSNDRRYLTRTITCTNLAQPLGRLALRSGCSSPQVLIWAMSWMISQYSGAAALPIAAITSNRLARDKGIDCRMRPIEFVLDFPRQPTSAIEAIRSARSVILEAYALDRKHGPVTPEQRVLTAVTKNRSVTVPIVFNIRIENLTGVVSSNAEERLDSWEDRWQSTGNPWNSFIWVDISNGTATIEFEVDSAILPGELTARIAESLPGFLEYILREPWVDVSSERLRRFCALPSYRGAALVKSGSWINRSTLRRSIGGQAPDVGVAELQEGDSGFNVVLSVRSRSQLADIHEALVSSIWLNVDACIPISYTAVIDGIRFPAWRPRDTPEKRAETAFEHALGDAFFEAHDFPVSDFSRSYVEAGGQLSLAPAITEILSRDGIVGIEPIDFESLVPLAAVANRLRHGPPGDHFARIGYRP